MAEREFTGVALFEVVVAVTDFVLAFGVLVVAVFFGKLFFKMAKPVERRI